MKLATTAKILATGLALLILVFEVAANDPIFVKWLVVDDPGDQTVRLYWERAEAGELSAEELVDLGTMLFYRGWPNDAVVYLREAVELDPELSDGWFRIGLVKHHSGDLSGARSAYKKCLKKQSGHAWANFYLGLLEEQTGEGRAAMEHYEMAFKHAPELADPKFNPEILSSRLQLGAQVRHFDSERFEKTMPMPFLKPATLRLAQKNFAQAPSPTKATKPAAVDQSTSTPTPVPDRATKSASQKSKKRQQSKATGAGAAAGGSADTLHESNTPYGVPEPVSRGAEDSGGGGTAPRIGETSPEASLRPLWPGLFKLVDALV